MMLFFSDPHVGVNRRANTTEQSRKRLAAKTVSLPSSEIEKVLASYPSAKVYCGGDMFDRFSNKEEVILEACQLMKHVTQCLAGNHDQINDSTKSSSLEVLESIFYQTTVSCRAGEKKFHVEHDEATKTVLYMVPHHSSQELMEETLIEVIHHASHHHDFTVLLLLHCNYDIPQEISNDVTLNLSSDDARYLLDECAIDYILMGHDHNSRELHNGRLRILGNCQPTSFSDIGDKFLTLWDGSEFTKIPIWKTKDRFLELNINNDWPLLPSSVEFLDIVGHTSPENATATVRQIQALWDEYPNLLAVRNSVSYDEIAGLAPEAGVELTTSTVYDLIESHIKNTDLHDLWLEMTKEIATHAE